jgi:hypothetical protein
VKAATFIVDEFVAPTAGYLKTFGLKLGIIVNFGQRFPVYQRIVF